MKTTKAVDLFLASCGARGLKPSTISFYRWGLGRLVGECSKLPRKVEEIERVMAVPGLAMESRRDLVRILGRFYTWGAQRYRWRNPMLELEKLPRPRRVPRVFSELEIEGLLGACRCRRDRAMVLLLLDTGLRVGELARLRRGDFGPGDLVVRDSKSGDRVVPVSPEVLRSLLGLGKGELVWVTAAGKALAYTTLVGLFRNLARRAGLSGSKVGPHTLRHTFATWYIAAGGSVVHLKEILGHSDLQTTMIYVTLAQTQVKADHAQHSPVRFLGLVDQLEVS